MCRPTRCHSCGDTTWAGCGQHVDQVMARVPEDARCNCDGRGSRRSSNDTVSGGLLGRFRRG